MSAQKRAFFVTGFIGGIVILGSVVMGIRPFLTRIGLLNPVESDDQRVERVAGR